MLYLAPDLDDVLLLISYIVECYVVGILVVGKTDDSLCSSIDGFLLRALIIKICSEVAVGMGDGKCRLERVLAARARISLASTDAIAAVRARLDSPVEPVEIGC